MKFYIIIIDDVYDFDKARGIAPIVRLTKAEARRELARLKASARETYGGQYDICDSSRDSFSMYPDGSWGTSHYDASISEVDVPGISRIRPRNRKRFRLDVVFGEDASRIAAEIGYSKVARRLGRSALTDGFGQEVDGSVDSVLFDTARDRDAAARLLDGADGWLGVYWEKKEA